jgi:hypothetical protein
MIAWRQGTDGTARSEQQRDERGVELAKCNGHPASGKPPSCEDCYFRRNLLCALELDAPCTTFRANRPEGLVPPRQPVLLMRAPRWTAAAR